MRRRLPVYALALLALAAVGALAQETVTIPAAAVVQQGKVTKMKMTLHTTGSVVVGGKSMPTDMQGGLLQTISYGTAGSDGLIPVTTSTALSDWKVMVLGKAQAVPATSIPPQTSYYDSQGNIKKVDSPALSGAGLNKEQMEMLARSSEAGVPPTGPIQMGKPVVKDIQLPVGPAQVHVSVTYTPTEAAEVGGEKAVKFQVSGNGDFSIKDLAGQPQGPKVNMKGTLALSGGMSVGLQTGEVIRQALTESVTATMDMAGAPMAMQTRITIEGYRQK